MLSTQPSLRDGLGSWSAAAAFDLARAELVFRLERIAGSLEGSMETAISGLSVHRQSNFQGSKPSLQTPAFALIAQGAKRLLVGEETYEYDQFNYMVSSVDLPVIAKVAVPSVGQPFLGMRLNVQAEDVRALIDDETLAPALSLEATRGLYISRLDGTLLDVVLRLLRLLDAPTDIPILAPMIKREILYRLLRNGQGGLLRQSVLQGSQINRVAKAITFIRENFVHPLRVEELAREVHMSVSTLHHHFKSVTAMSPLQYQKHVRLLEARRLLVSKDMSVALAAHAVGYESTSQFSREYSRLFGMPPLRDKQQRRR